MQSSKAKCAYQLRNSGQSVISEYEAGQRQPALPTLSKLITATGHQLVLGLERTDPAVRGLPDTPLGRRLRQHQRALLDADARAGGSHLRVFGSVARGEDSRPVTSTCSSTSPRQQGCSHCLAWKALWSAA